MVKTNNYTLILDYSTDVEDNQTTSGGTARALSKNIETSTSNLEPTNLPLALSPSSQPMKSSSEHIDETTKSACKNNSSLNSNSATFGKFIRQLSSQTFCSF